MKKLTPVLVVDDVKPCVDWWCGRLGFEKRVEVPEGSALGFVILVVGDVEIMYQSRRSVAADIPALTAESFHTCLFLEVSDLDSVERRLQGADFVFARRQTPYGATEIAVHDPANNVVVFAQFG